MGEESNFKIAQTKLTIFLDFAILNLELIIVITFYFLI